MSLLFPGEKIGSVSANRPSANYDGFSSAMLRHVAAGTGLVAQQISQNWSEINYSAFRAAMLEAWKTFHRRRYDFAVNSRRPWPLRSWKSLWKWTTTHAVGTCAAFLGGKVGVLPGAVDGARQGVCGSRQGKAGCHSWFAVGLVHAGHRGSEQGEDWREVADQRAVEQAYYRERDLPMPVWSVEQPKEPPASSPNAGDEDKERA